MSNALRHGDWSLRTDTLLGGVPLYNFAQLSAFYPRSNKYFAMAVSGIVLLTLASLAQPLIHAIVLSIVLVFIYALKLSDVCSQNPI